MMQRHPGEEGETTQPDDMSQSPAENEEVTTVTRGRSASFVVVFIHVNICMYAACFFIQMGSLPYLSKKLGVDPVMFGYLQSSFAIVQLLGGPLFGRFGDIYGSRAALTLAFLSAALSYGLTAVSTSIPLLFLSRVPSVFMHAMQGGQMAVTDLCESQKRADALGKLGLSYGIGMVAGPFLGGILTKQYGEEMAAGVACVGSLFSALMCLYYLPPHAKHKSTTKEPGTGTVFDVKKIISLVKHPRALLLLLVKGFSGIPIGIFQSMFAVVAMETFHLEADQNGYIMSYIGVLAMITQGVGIGFLLKRMSEMNIIKLSAFILVWAYLLLAFIQTVAQLCLVLVLMCVGLTLMSVVISSALTHTVSDSDTGSMLGLNMAINSLIRTVSPTIGGYMLFHMGFPSFGALGFINNFLVTAYLMATQAQ